MEFKQLLQSRFSVNQFDPNGVISRKEVEDIIQDATLSPSSFNLQHWRFLIIDDQKMKLKLKSVANNQQKIEDAAASIVVLGNLTANRDGKRIADDLSAKGFLPEEYKENLINSIQGLYGSEAMKRDEAIRGASLAAMTLMLAAKDKGFGTCPMIGFDPVRLCEEFNIPEHLIPVMIIPIGPVAETKNPRKLRFSVNEITTYNGF